MKVYVAMYEVVGASFFGHYLKDVIKCYGRKCDIVRNEMKWRKMFDVSIDNFNKHNSKCIGVFKSKKAALKACSDFIDEIEHENIKNQCEYDIVKHRYGTCLLSEAVQGVTVECAWVEVHTF
ncbi:MAG: hypothetical protein J6R18_00385 [Kiritimatiellae bacterium]|nr:hypothetical protein [Kiritimatiellia bacterium]